MGKALQGAPELMTGEFAMIIVGIDVASQKHDYFMMKSDTGEKGFIMHGIQEQKKCRHY